MIEQPGHLPPKVAKRPGGVNRNERWARPALAAKIEVADLRALQTSRKVFVSSLRGGDQMVPAPKRCRLVRRHWVTICQVVSNPWDTGSSGVTVPMWATYSPSCVGTGARSAPRYWLAVQQQSASVRPVASRKP